MSAIDEANLLAGHAVAYATAYLDGRHSAATLAEHTNRLQLDLADAVETNAGAILVPVRLLNIAMMRTARAELNQHGAARVERWCKVMGAIVDLITAESKHLYSDGKVG